MNQTKMRRVLNQALMNGTVCNDFNCKIGERFNFIDCSYGYNDYPGAIKCYLWINTKIKTLLKGH